MFGLFSKTSPDPNRESVRKLQRCLMAAERNETAVIGEIKQLEDRGVELARSGQTDRLTGTARSIQRLTRSRQSAERRVDKLRDWVMAAKLSRDDRELADVLQTVAGQMKVKVNQLPGAIDAFTAAVDGLESREEVWRDAEELDNANAQSTQGVPSVSAIMQGICSRAAAADPVVGHAPAQAHADETGSLRERARTLIEHHKEG